MDTNISPRPLVGRHLFLYHVSGYFSTVQSVSCTESKTELPESLKPCVSARKMTCDNCLASGVAALACNKIRFAYDLNEDNISSKDSSPLPTFLESMDGLKRCLPVGPNLRES